MSVIRNFFFKGNLAVNLKRAYIWRYSCPTMVTVKFWFNENERDLTLVFDEPQVI